MKNIFTISLLSLSIASAHATMIISEDNKIKAPSHKSSIAPMKKQVLALPDILKPGKNITKENKNTTFHRSGPTIQLAILLDGSGSMDGLLEQAKIQIWDIINATSKANKDNEDATIEVALFVYGKDSISKNEGYIKMLSPLTSDLDAISEELFALRTNGGSEYAGKVILESVNRLAWSNNEDDLKIIIIAGNESFNQGDVKYKYAIDKAKGKDIIVNTVFCGDYLRGVQMQWREASKISGGAYLNIEQNNKVRYIETPFDEEINFLGTEMNSTYVNYGSKGQEMQARQVILDHKTKNLSKSLLAKRNVAKSSKSYDASSWDVISKLSESKEVAIEAAQDSTEFKGLSNEEIGEKIQALSDKRDLLKSKIKVLTVKRDKYIVEERKKSKDSNQDSFGSKLISDIEIKAKEKGYLFK